MVVIAKHQPLLQRLGLATLAEVKRFQGELVKNHRGRRDIFRVRVQAEDGHDQILFLKRNWNPYRKDGLLSFLRRGRVWSLSRQEWENSRKLTGAGLKVAEPVAYGEECGWLWEKFSFLVTEAAFGRQTLDQFLRECRDPTLRRRVFAALAREIRRMHDAGLASPDLFTRHLFVESGGERPQFCFIDMARLDQRRHLPERLRARDLAALNASAPLRFVTLRERARFLQAYAGHVDRRLWTRIDRRVQHLLQRRKFREFPRAS